MSFKLKKGHKLQSGFMDLALEEARAAASRGEVPVGAVLVSGKEILASNGNRTLEMNDPSAHAELLVIREACSKQKSQRLHNCDLYVTLEPCTLCAAAISFARIRRLYFGAEDSKTGGVISGVQFFKSSTCHHSPEVYSGICDEDAGMLLKSFFAEKRS